MKKTVVSLATGLIIAGTAVTSVSAEEYQVKKGDSLWEIAQDYESSVNHLKELNNLDTDIIKPNQQLQIDIEETYKVKQGDTLIGIADEHDVSVSDLKMWNGLSSDLIVIGEELKIEALPAGEEDTEVQQASEPAPTPVKSTDSDSEPKQVEKAEAPKAEEDTATKSKAESSKTEEASGQAEAAKKITVTATAYTGDCDGCSGITSTGINLNENPDAKVIAVDPDVIPLGTKVHVEGYGEAVAGDVGGGIHGKEIDVHVPTKDEAFGWGRKTVDVTILK